MPVDVPFELYDMTIDQGETKNLADAMPGVLNEMKAAYKKWFSDVSSTRPSNYDPPRIVVGSDAEPISVLTPQDWRVGDTEGWGKGGRWLINVVRPGRFDAEIIWKDPIGPATVTLHVGSQSKSVQIGPNLSRAKIDTMALTAGASAVRVEAINRAGQRDPYHVILRRIDQ